MNNFSGPRSHNHIHSRTLQHHGRSGVSASPLLERVETVVPLAPIVPDDVALVSALLRGDESAPATLFDRYGNHVQRVLVRVLGYAEPERADLLHDVFVRSLERIANLQNPRALKAWLTGITVFTAQEWIRRRRRVGPPLAPDDADERTAPSIAPEAREAVRSFYALMDRLDGNERAAFILRHVEGMNLNEVAEACDVSLSTARRRIDRADDRFRQMLAQYPALLERLRESQR
jgi:RNA polymerase sigma-70 factor (ECF subfamily)